MVDEPCGKAQQGDGDASPPPPSQQDAGYIKEDIVPDQIEQDLPGLKIINQVIFIQDLHHGKAEPGAKQVDQAAEPLARIVLHVLPQAGKGVSI